MTRSLTHPAGDSFAEVRTRPGYCQAGLPGGFHGSNGSIQSQVVSRVSMDALRRIRTDGRRVAPTEPWAGMTMATFPGYWKGYIENECATFILRRPGDDLQGGWTTEDDYDAIFTSDVQLLGAILRRPERSRWCPRCGGQLFRHATERPGAPDEGRQVDLVPQ